MRATCRHRSLSALAAEVQAHVRQSLHQDEIELVPGQDYEVVGVLFRDGVPWLYVCEDENAEYPVPYCIEFFERERLTIPPEWELVWTGQHSQLSMVVRGSPLSRAAGRWRAGSSGPLQGEEQLISLARPGTSMTQLIR